MVQIPRTARDHQNRVDHHPRSGAFRRGAGDAVRVRIAAAAALLLGACGSEPPQQPDTVNATISNGATSPTPATSPSQAASAIGTRSNLTAQTSALHGEITAFQVEITETAT